MSRLIVCEDGRMKEKATEKLSILWQVDSVMNEILNGLIIIITTAEDNSD
jgi:hypothetical protein